LVFEPTGAAPESLLGNHDALRLPVNIEIERRRPLTTRMWEQLFQEMGDAALKTDLRLYEEASGSLSVRDGGEGFRTIIRQTDRFVVTSIDRGSIEITGAVLLAAGWVYKKFIEPGWEKSGSKKSWDSAVASMIDKSVPILKEQIDVRVVHKLKRLNIRRVSFRRPLNGDGFRLTDNSTPDTELIYEKPKRIASTQNKESPR
jgi:hypothetical protein